MSEIQGKVFQVQYLDKAAVYNCYMSFVKDGGIFVPSNHDAHLGEPVMMMVLLPDLVDPFFLATKVVFIGHGRRRGFGVRLSGDEGSLAFKIAVENLLGGQIKSTMPTYTM